MSKILEEDLEDNLLNQQDIEFVREKVDNNTCKILGDYGYEEENTELATTRQLLTSILNSEKVEEIFLEYEDCLRRSNERQNCLAYYIGLKKGMQMRDIKVD